MLPVPCKLETALSPNAMFYFSNFLPSVDQRYKVSEYANLNISRSFIRSTNFDSIIALPKRETPAPE